jgi:hypothetical protein
MLGGHEPRNHTLTIPSPRHLVSQHSLLTSHHILVFDIHIDTTLKLVRVLTAKVQSSQRNESQRAWRPWHSSTKPQERGSARESLSTEIEHRHTQYHDLSSAITTRLSFGAGALCVLPRLHCWLATFTSTWCFDLHQSLHSCRSTR